MMKAASVSLRTDITLADVDRMIGWMGNPNVTRFLNEDPQIVHFLGQLRTNVPEPMLNYHFNRLGRFLLVCTPQGQSIGFVKLTPHPAGVLRNRLRHRRREPVGPGAGYRRRPGRPEPGLPGMGGRGAHRQGGPQEFPLCPGPCLLRLPPAGHQRQIRPVQPHQPGIFAAAVPAAAEAGLNCRKGTSHGVP